MSYFDFKKAYTVKELIEIFELPIFVKRSGWTNDYTYEIREIDNDKTKGYAYKGARIHSTTSTYPITTAFYVCTEHRSPKFKVSSVYNEEKNEQVVEQKSSSDKEDEVVVEPTPEQRVEASLKLIPNKSVVYVRKDGKWTQAIYLRFELRQVDSEKGFVIWVRNEGRESFYKYPSEFVAFSVTEKEQKAENEIIFTTSETKNEKIININACSKFPKSVPAQDDENLEFEHEVKHHGIVDAYLLERREKQYGKIGEASNIEIEASQRKREGIKEAQEMGEYEFNSHFYNAGKLYEKAQIIRKNASDEINFIQRVRREPYFGRIDWGPSKDRIHTIYFGEEDVEGFVTDWRDSSVGNLWYHTEDILETTDVKIPLRRRFSFDDYKLKSITTEINDYVEGFVKQLDPESVRKNTDEMFTKLLEDSRNEQEVHDIIKTIRSNQYDIISSDFDSNIVVDGCAGSGKTMILYHRLSFMAYNDANRFNINNCYVITPTARYASINSKLFEKLKLNELRNNTPEEFIRHLIGQYCNKNGVFDSTIFSLKDKVDNSDINLEYFDKNKINQFFEIIDNIKEDTRDFYLWYTKRINKLLQARNLPLANEIDMLIGKNNALIAQYTSDEKIEKAYKNGTFRTADWNSMFEEIKNKGETNNIERLWKYEIPLKMVLGSAVNSNSKDAVTLFGNKKDFENFLLLQLLEKHISVLREFYKNPDNDSAIFMALCEYAMELMKKKEEKLDSTKTYRFEILYYLHALVERYKILSSERTLIFVDEFQNYSKFELMLIKDSFENAIYNFYGDYSQKMMKCGLSKYDITELFDPYCYQIKENYRNAKEITEYINANLGTSMRSIGIHGLVKYYDNEEDCDIRVDGRTAILYDGENHSVLEMLKKKKVVINKTFENNRIVSDKINVLSIIDARGLEFETVYVWLPEAERNSNDPLLTNKKYVAYTRALNNLTIIEPKKNK